MLAATASARGVDLHGWETALRVAALSAGSRVLGQLLDGIGSGRQGEPLACPGCGRKPPLVTQARFAGS